MLRWVHVSFWFWKKLNFLHYLPCKEICSCMFYQRCIRKLISRHCLETTRTRWNDFLFLITDDRDFRPQTCTNGLVFRECKHIKNIFEDVYFTKNYVSYKQVTYYVPRKLFQYNFEISHFFSNKTIPWIINYKLHCILFLKPSGQVIARFICYLLLHTIFFSNLPVRLSHVLYVIFFYTLSFSQTNLTWKVWEKDSV
jgi:hypothetical protein